jgi:streptogramin lyase
MSLFLNALQRFSGLVGSAAIVASLAATVGAANADSYTRFTYSPVPAERNLQKIAPAPDGNVWVIANTNSYDYPSSLLRVTPAGVRTEFPIGSTHDIRYTGLVDLVAGPDGVLWVINTIDNTLTRVGLDGAVINAYPIPADSNPSSPVVGPDGNIWFLEPGFNKLAQMTPAGVLTEIPVGATRYSLMHLAAGTDGALWFTGSSPEDVAVFRMTTAGGVTKFTVPAPTASGVINGIDYITAGPDGNMWFTSYDSDAIERITPSGTITQFYLPPSQTGPGPGQIIAGSDGALWFTESGYSNHHPNGLGRMTVDGVYTEFLTPTDYTTYPQGVALGSDGNLWMSDNTVGSPDNLYAVWRFVVPAPPGNSPLVAATLPTSRSVQVGNTATIFATMINTSANAASSCGIGPITVTPGGMVFQTTDPTTNALTGQLNSRVSIAAGASQSFVVAFNATGPLAPVDAKLAFGCDGLVPVVPITGLNTVLLTYDANPVPDIIALAASADAGIVDLPGANGEGLFAVATFNLGSTAPITVTADTGPATIPVTLSICQSDPQTAQCTSVKGASVTTTINHNASPTFDIFVEGTGTVPFDPAHNRIFVRFTDANGVVRGSTSVAARTQ